MVPEMYADGPYRNVTNLPTAESRIKPLWVQADSIDVPLPVSRHVPVRMTSQEWDLG